MNPSLVLDALYALAILREEEEALLHDAIEEDAKKRPVSIPTLDLRIGMLLYNGMRAGKPRTEEVKDIQFYDRKRGHIIVNSKPRYSHYKGIRYQSGWNPGPYVYDRAGYVEVMP